ncbi:FkbM family methyltransferase [Vulcanisaeta sp. JCM 16161]|uniref:FkbM family methyltransferase n=1 Tax=Vulcanisaeta sp. JCM 16161 TaxID=1295372 RepID=UPI00406CFABE
MVLRTIKVVLAILKSKPLFRNYYGSLFKYGLSRFGLVGVGDLAIRCFDGSEMRVDPRMFSSVIHLYLDGVINGIDCVKGAIKTVNGSLVPIDEFVLGSAVEVALRNGWGYDLNGRYWFKGGVRFRHMHWPIIETFDLGQYDFMNVDGRVVLDIGAFVGDTAIYFTMRGARLVHAVEPLPSNYEEMLQNITLNGLDNRVIPMKLLIGYGERRVSMPHSTDVNLRGGSVSEVLRVPHGGYEYVDVMPLRELYEALSIKPDVLKLDCEGCEFDVILNDYETIRRFNEIVFEYHSYITGRSVGELMSILSKDFRCSFVNDEFYRKYYSNFSRDELGMIHCVKAT